MNDAVRNKYDLVMSSGMEGGPEPFFPIRRLTGTTILRSLDDRASPGHFWPESHIPIMPFLMHNPDRSRSNGCLLVTHLGVLECVSN